MKHVLLLLTLSFSTSVSLAAIYTWTDSKGEVHFSDKPRKGAKQVDLPPVQTYSPATTTQASEASENPPEKAFVYKSIQFSQPSDGATIRNNTGRIPVSVQITPVLRSQDRLQILFDGVELAPKDQEGNNSQQPTSFVLENVYRGEHSLEAKVIDATGELMIETEQPLIFYLHRPRTGMSSATPRPRGGR